MAASPPAPHLPTLDGLRGIAALLVVFGHAELFGLPQLVPLELGTWGVLLFFVLSGFLMGHLYLTRPFETGALARYGAARIARIVPLYWLVIVASWALFRFVEPDFIYRIDDYRLLRHLAFTGSEAVFWSIGPEFQFYAVFPLLWWAADRARGGAWRPLAAVLAGCGVIFLCQPWFPGIVFASKLHIFLAGIGLALLRPPVARHLAAGRALPAVQFAALLLLTALLLPAPWLGELLYPARHGPLLNEYYGDLRRVGIAASIVLALSFASPLANALLANRAARALGAISFSLYLLHQPVFWALRTFGAFDTVPGTPGFLLGLAASCLVAWLSYRLIEIPSREGLRGPLARWLEARLRAAAPGLGARR